MIFEGEKGRLHCGWGNSCRVKEKAHDNLFPRAGRKAGIDKINNTKIEKAEEKRALPRKKATTGSGFYLGPKSSPTDNKQRNRKAQALEDHVHEPKIY